MRNVLLRSILEESSSTATCSARCSTVCLSSASSSTPQAKPVSGSKELEKLVRRLEREISAKEAELAAIDEALAGAAKGTQSCVCITLGTGVGGGIIIGGKIYGGFNFAGAELGHIVINVDGELCTCGRHGCWEAYASATALIRQTRQAMVANPDSAMWRIAGTLDKVDGRTAFDAMRAGDVVGKKVVDRYIQYIACGLINVINIFQPEVLCIGGGICKEGDTLLKPLEAHIAKERYSKFSTHQTRLCVATLGNDAGIIGAAFLDEGAGH